MKKTLAVKWLHLPDGRVLKDQVVEFLNGEPYRYYPLVEECPFTEWFGGHYDYRKKEQI